jgi:hypothetical protein
MDNNLGNLAYYDTFASGLVPVKVTGFDGINVYFTITATRKAYKRCERLSSVPFMIVPRECVRVSCGQYLINPNYTWINGIDSVYAIKTKGEK